MKIWDYKLIGISCSVYSLTAEITEYAEVYCSAFSHRAVGPKGRRLGPLRLMTIQNIYKKSKGEFIMKILVGFDGTNAAGEAIALAEQHSRAFGATIILAYSMVGGPDVPRKDFEIAENSLGHEKNILLDKKIPCETIMSVRGLEAGEDLVQLAGQHKADEVIVGVRRRSKVGKIIFGSTAQYVVLNAPCPVVTVK